MGIRRFSTGVPVPFRLDLTVRMLRRRPHNAIDGWDGSTWRRSLATDHGAVALAVTQPRARGGPRLAVAVESPGAPPGAGAVAEARRVVTRALGREVDLAPFYRLAGRDRRSSTWLSRRLTRQTSSVRPTSIVARGMRGSSR